MGIIELNQRIKAINKELLKVLAIEANAERLRKMNIDQHLSGVNAKGQKIRPKYSEAYHKRKKRLGYSGDGTPDFRLSGLFHQELDLIVMEDEYILTSYADYTRFLAARYDDIFGLTKENKKEAELLCTRKFIELWKEKAGL